MDRRLMGALRESGEIDDTHVFCIPDNDRHVGGHRPTIGKRTAYEEDVRAPLVVSSPGCPTPRPDSGTRATAGVTFDRVCRFSIVYRGPRRRRPRSP
jgi:arylsulfatase A-like enzyme